MIIGITGGISTGKSTAAEVIAATGVRIIDCDEISHYLTNYDANVLTAIRAHFGSRVFHRGGALNRSELASIVFSNHTERLMLEHILHPKIIGQVRENCISADGFGEPLVVVAPLLIEAGMQKDVDVVWVISCEPEIQIERLCQRANITPEKARRWIEAQMPLEDKERVADKVIENNGTVEEFTAKIAAEWQSLGLV